VAIISTEIKPTPKVIAQQITPEVTSAVRSLSKKGTRRKETDVSFWLAISALSMGLVLGFGLIKKKDTAIKLSQWAKRNKRISIGIIIATKAALTGIGFYSGKLLLDSGFHNSPTLTYSLAATMVIAGITYPRKKAIRGFWKHSYLKQKLHDLALTLCGFFLITAISNQSNFTVNNHSFTNQVNTEHCADAKKWFRSDFREAQTKGSSTHEKDEPSVGTKVLITILLLILVVFLSMLLSVLVCGLSCSGQELAAALVGTGGILVIAAILLLGLRGIWRKKAPKKESRYEVK